MKPVRNFLNAVSATALALSPAVGGAVAVSVAAVTMAEAAVVRSISVSGNTRMTSSTIADIIDYEPGRNFSDADRDEAVKRLFATGMFSNARVTVSGSTLVVQVWENAIINQVIFRGNRKQKDERLKAVVESQPRGSFEQAILDADVEAIIESYSRVGRNDVSVSSEVIDLGEGRVNIVFQIQEGDRTKIAEINIVGNNAFSDRRLYSVLSTKRSNPLSWLTRNDIYDDQRLAADEERLRRFYFNHGYADFRILSSEGVVDPNTGNVVITIRIDEGERYSFGNIEIDSTITGVSAEDLRSTVSTRTGTTYNAKKVEDSLIAMSERLAEAGFPFAEVTPIGDRNFATGSIDVRYRCRPGSAGVHRAHRDHRQCAFTRLHHPARVRPRRGRCVQPDPFAPGPEKARSARLLRNRGHLDTSGVGA